MNVSRQDESSIAAPVLTLPSISEDEEEEEDDDEDNNNEHTMSSKETIREEDEGGEDGRGNTQMSPLLTSQISRDAIGGSDWLASRGKLPNGHISAAIRFV